MNTLQLALWVGIFLYFSLLLLKVLRCLKSFSALQRHARRLRTFRHLEAIDQTSLTPLSLVLPLSRLSVANVMQWIALDYPDLEYILVHDQVTPQVMLTWRDRLHLKPTARFPVGDLNTAVVQGVYQGEDNPRIWFIDKAPSHLSDALNTGLNFCQTPLIAIVSAEVFPEPGIFQQSARMFLEDKQVWAVSGRIRSHEHPERRQPELPSSTWGKFEVIYEQFQQLLQWAPYAVNRDFYELSPLYSVFRRSNLLESGGFTGQYQSFMVDIVRNLRDLAKRRGQHFYCHFLPDTLGWKAAAASRKDMQHFFAYHQQVAKRLLQLDIPFKSRLHRRAYYLLFPFGFGLSVLSTGLLASQNLAYLLVFPLLFLGPLVLALLGLRASEFSSRRYAKEDLIVLLQSVWKYLFFWPAFVFFQQLMGWFRVPQPLRETSREALLNPSPLRYTAPLDLDLLEDYENGA